MVLGLPFFSIYRVVEAWFWHNTGRLKPGSGRLRNLPGSTLSDLRPKSRGLWLKGCGAPVLENGGGTHLDILLEGYLRSTNQGGRTGANPQDMHLNLFLDL